MINGLVTLRTRAAEQAAGRPVRIGFRPARLEGKFRANGDTLVHDLNDGQEVRVWLTSSNLPISLLPGPEIAVRRPGIVGVKCNGTADNARPFIHFLGSEGAITSRPVEFGEQKWFEPPEGTESLAISLIVEGSGTVELGEIDVVVPPHRGTLPGRDQLMADLARSRFPVGPTAWPLRHTVTFDRSDGISLNGQSLELGSFDWDAVSERSRSHQLLVHGFSFAEAVIASGGAEELARLFEEWADLHPERPHSTTIMSWNDMAVAKRTMALLATLNAVRLSDPFLASRLADMIASHASWLAHPRNYLADHDHGLFADTALAFAARVLWMHPVAPLWSDLAQRRFASTCAAVVDADEATVREHSPAYVGAVADLVAERRRSGLRDDLPVDIGDRFQTTLSILTTPTGTLIPWGDTALDAGGIESELRGVWSFPRTGWAVSHHPGTVAGITSAYHSASHKHGDALSIVYYDREGPVIFEAGLPGYEYRSDDRSYAESPRAHNTAIVEGASLPWREVVPFGSAVWPSAASGPWHLMAGTDPSLSGARHDRLVLHHPNTLIIVDVLVGAMASEITRFLHFAPDQEPSIVDNSRVKISRRTVTLFSSTSPTRATVASGPEWIHFPDQTTSASHSTLIMEDSDPGVRAVVVSDCQPPVSVESIDHEGDRHRLVLTIRLSEGTVLTIKARPSAKPGAVSLVVT